MMAGLAMKKMIASKTPEPMSSLNIPGTRKAKKTTRRRSSDSTLMVMSVMAGIGIGFIGLVFTGQI